MADMKYIIDTSDVVSAQRDIRQWAKVNRDSLNSVNQRMGSFGKTSELAFNQFGRAASKAQQKSKRFASVGMQQVGYQVQDFAVQVQSGTNSLVALGQQGSQLLGIFGPAGAIAGMILAIGTGLANAFLSARDAAKSATDATEVFAKAAKDAKSTIANLSAELKVLKGGYEDVTEAALDSALKQAEAALQAAKAQTVQAMGAFGAMGGGQETIDRRVAAAEKELKLAQQKLDNYQKLIAEEERLSQKSEEANQERMLGEQMLQKERDDALAQFEADLLATSKTLDAVFKSRTLFYNIRFAGEEAVMSQPVMQPPKAPEMPSYKELRGMGWTDEDIKAMGVNVPRKSVGGGGGVGRDPAEDRTRAREALTSLIAQYDEGVAEAQKLSQAQETINEAVRNGVITTEQGQTAMQGYIQSLDQANNPIKQLGDTLKNSLGDAFTSIVDGSKSAGEAFRDMARMVIKQAFEMLVVQPILNSMFGGGGGGSFLTALFSANGNAFTKGGKVTPFADGGVVSAPTAFQHSGGLGVMGEAGPEAIMPLKRGKNGKLGVQADGGGQQPVVINQSFNFSANGDDSVKRIIAQEAPRIANLTQKQILDQRRRGGTFKSTFG